MGVTKKWSTYRSKKTVTMRPKKIVKRDAKVFTIGSCFAVRIREALIKKGFDVYPKYETIQIKGKDRSVGAHGPTGLQHYHTHAIRQEFERSLGLDESYNIDDCWVKRDHVFKERSKNIFQDPYRRLVYSKTKEGLKNLNDEISSLVREGIENADVFVITLGLIETWTNKKTGKTACMNPGYGGGGGQKESVFHLSSFAENLENARETIKIIKQVNPDATIFITTSPVPLGSTATDRDVLVANTASKSMLRTVCEEVTREFSDVLYFPAYEICLNEENPFIKDGRHVHPATVTKIVNTFVSNFCEGK